MNVPVIGTHGIYGLFGSGKTMLVIRLSRALLKADKRPIIAYHVPFKGARYSGYMERYSERFGVCPDMSRLIVLPEDDETGRIARNFWRYRARWDKESQQWILYELPEWPEDKFERGQLPGPAWKRQEGDIGVIRLMDEIYADFSPDDFQKIQRGCRWYINQQRKYVDLNFMVAPSEADLSIAFRRKCASHTHMRNYGAENFYGFKLWKNFEAGVYLQAGHKPGEVPTGGVATFRLEPDLADCYETGGGAGVAEIGGDKDLKRHGIPWQVGVGVIVGFAALVVWGIGHISDFVVHGLSRHSPKQVVTSAAASIAPAVVMPPRVVIPTVPMPNVGPAVVSWWRTGAEWRFKLADGRVLLNPRGARFDGDRLVIGDEVHPVRLAAAEGMRAAAFPVEVRRED